MASVGLMHNLSKMIISNDHSFHQKHPGVPAGSDSSDGIAYPLTENYMLPVARATLRVAYIPLSLCTLNSADVYAPSEGQVCYTPLRG